MSNKNVEKDRDTRRRPYKLKARARRWEDVRRRITTAAVHLHETVGPARTTMNAIAKLAGVQRATVYNHFPTDLELIDACSSHWFAENPPPDQTDWLHIQDPAHQTRRALQDMYEYYDRSRDMLAKVLRDAAVVPAMDEIRRQKWLPLLAGIVDLLIARWSGSVEQVTGSHRADTVDQGKNGKILGRTRVTELRASLTVALDFFTWQTLTESGLSSREAAALAAGWAESAGKSGP